MKKLYRGCIWVIILLSIMASQSVFATQTIQGEWEQTSLSQNVWEILGNNAREQIIESQYAFTLTGEAEVTTRLTAFADTYVYLFLINSSGQLELAHREDGSGIMIDGAYFGESVIQKTLSSGDYFIVPTTYSSETYSPPKAYVLEITIVSNSGNLIPEAELVNANGTIPNDASQFSGDTTGAGNEDSSINGTLTATDVEGLTDDSYFTVTTGPLNGTASIGAGNGVWQYEPVPNYFGVDQFTVTVTDDVGGMTDQVISLTVIPVDDAALFSGDTSAIGDEDTEISGTLLATDVENLSGSYFTVTSASTNGIAAIDGETGEWLYRPIESYSGEDAFTVTVTDDTSGTTTQVISITVNSVDDPAIFSGNISGAGNEDMAINGTLTASDIDGLTDDSYFTVTTGPSNGTASIGSGNGIWQYTPILNYFGEDQFTVTVTDDLDGTTDQVISVIVTPVDDVALFSGNTSGEGQEDNPVTGTLTATDIDGLTDDSYYTVTEDPLHGTATIDQTSGFWQYTPQSNYFGSDAFTITVTDDRDGTSAQTINISLSADNDAPIITSNALATATENQLYSYSVTTIDVEGDTLSLSVTSIPDWLSFNAATGVLSGTPVHMHAEIGTHGVVIRADDGIDSVEQSFTITVEDVNNPPTVTLIASNFIEDAGGLVAGASAAASYQIEDLDGDELTVTFEQGTNGNNHYSLDTAEQKIFLTQVGIDTINLGNPLDSISLTVVEVQTNSSGGSSSQPTDPNMPDVPLEDPFDTVSSSPGDSVDGSSVSATVTPGVTPSNDRPTAISKTGANAVAATEQTQTSAITLEGTDQEVEALSIYKITSLPTEGDLKDENVKITSASAEVPHLITGTLTYTSTSDTATNDSFTFKVNDGQLDSDLATVSITITPVNDAPLGEVTISGIVAQGQTLTVSTNLTDSDGLGTISYQWQADNQDIAGADQTTYQLTQTDINKSVIVTVSYTDGQGTLESVTSSNTTNQMLDQALSQLRADIANSSATDYVNAGITGVSDTNVTSINDAMKSLDADNQGQIQQLVGSYNRIFGYSADSSTNSAPIADDFSNIGVDDVTQDAQAISLLNDVIALGDKSAVDTIAKLQALMTAVTSVLNLPEGQIDTLSKQQLELLGVEGATDNNLLAIRQMMTSDNQAMGKLSDIQGIVNKVVASHKIQAYSANSSNNSIPTLDDYKTIGLPHLVQADIETVNSVIEEQDSSAIDSIEKIVALITVDTDGDSMADVFDSFPNDASEISDSDGDAIGDNADNCPNTANTNQANFDADAMGDACDPDVDNDGIVNSSDNCPNIVNPKQLNLDADSFGDICDTDKDNDGMENILDNCPNQANADQLDLDSDNIGDICDEDKDNDQVKNTTDNCLNIANTNQLDFDNDSVGDICDVDKDGDGLENNIDNCPNQANADQLDLDLDNVGDICDEDKDNDQVKNTTDNCLNVANTNQLDFDKDTIGDACDLDEDNDGIASVDDAFKFNPNYSSDADGDGMADAFEREHGFDITNAGDKTTDSDGDGISNLDEFLAGTNPRVNPNPGLPELVVPNDIEEVSTGRMTTVDIGLATATDGSNAELQPVASYRGPFSAGRHEITWTATDSQGNQSKAVQVVKVLPLVNLTPSSLIAEGGEVNIRAILSGDAADYPVEIPYTVSGSAINEVDYQVVQSDGVIKIEQGIEASFRLDVNIDEEPENNETIEITLDSPTNAVLGSVTERTITIIDGNLPPQIAVVVEQDGNVGRVIAADKGQVTITATVSDPNPKDTHTFNWEVDEQQSSAVVSNTTIDNKKTLVIDPSQLEPGIFSIIAKAVDSAAENASTEVKTDFRLMKAAPVLSADTDSDGDGISDADEGYADSDSDGIVDYMDNIVEPNLAPVGEDSSIVLQAVVGTQIVLGEAAFSNAKSTVKVSKNQIIDIALAHNPDSALAALDSEYTYPYGLYDFVVSGEIPGNSYYLVLPLEVPFAQGQVFRKYMGPQIGWQNFIENANNALYSATATNGACPEPGSRLFVSNIQVGHTCIQLYIEDGGPNDADGIANGVVTDPAGVAIYTKQGVAPSAKNSVLEINPKELTVGEKALITITAINDDGSFMEKANVTATCKYCRGITIGPMTELGQGIYTAVVTSGIWYSNSSIEAVISNEFGSATLEPVGFLVKLKKRGGCSIVQGQPADISLFIILFIITLVNYRKRRISNR